MITNAILSDEDRIITVSNYDSIDGIYIGCPAIVNINGVKERIYVELNHEEQDKLSNSIGVIKNAIDSIDE